MLCVRQLCYVSRKSRSLKVVSRLLDITRGHQVVRQSHVPMSNSAGAPVACNVSNGKATQQTAKAAGRGHFFCYLLRSLNRCNAMSTYIGFTVNPKRRIRQHNGEIKAGARRVRRCLHFCIVSGHRVSCCCARCQQQQQGCSHLAVWFCAPADQV